ncbi:MAG: hypothetical protein JW759_00840 [Candidatus Coatesbacteria bacterium]|nr:hypothetical protein [Candidatus Coatesbacteria bacterium]
MTSKDGLATDSTTCVGFDSQGVAWIGSGAGVTRWDGGSFRTFTVENGLPANSVSRLTIDAQDRPWVITAGKAREISHFNGTSWQVRTGDENGPEGPLLIAADTRGAVWVLGRRLVPGTQYTYTFPLYSYEGETWREWTTKNGYPLVSTGAPFLYCDSSGNVFTSGRSVISKEYCLGIFDGSSWTHKAFRDYVVSAAEDGPGRLWLNQRDDNNNSTVAAWDRAENLDVLTAEEADISCNAISGVSTGPHGDIYIMSVAGLECHYLNPNVAAIANGKSFAPGDPLSLKYWAENPGGADRELDLYILITLPTGDSVYLPTLRHDLVPFQTITIPKETTLNPTEIPTLAVPADLPAGEYTVTPWFCDHGLTEQTGQCTPLSIVIANRS